MSYCRWSSDNFRCDLYCYADVGGGYTTHVAGRRRIGLENLPPDPLTIITLPPDEWLPVYRAHRAALDALPFEDITLPHSGESFNDPDLASFKERLLYLRKLGYHFPDYVLETIDEETAEENATEITNGPR